MPVRQSRVLGSLYSYPIVKIKYCSLREHDKNLETKSTLAKLLHLCQGNTFAGQVTSLLGRSPEQTAEVLEEIPSIILSESIFELRNE